MWSSIWNNCVIGRLTCGVLGCLPMSSLSENHPLRPSPTMTPTVGSPRWSNSSIFNRKYIFDQIRLTWGSQPTSPLRRRTWSRGCWGRSQVTGSALRGSLPTRGSSSGSLPGPRWTPVACLLLFKWQCANTCISSWVVYWSQSHIEKLYYSSVNPICLQHFDGQIKLEYLHICSLLILWPPRCCKMNKMNIHVAH